MAARGPALLGDRSVRTRAASGERLEALDGVGWVAVSPTTPPDESDSVVDRTFDLAIVGGGLGGLSVALHAARRGLSVAVLEQATVGAGASGRNAGFVIPHYPANLSPADVERMLGPRRGPALNALLAGGPTQVRELIRAHGIDCDAEFNGWLQPAHSEAAQARARRSYEDWRAFGAEVEWLDAAATADALGTDTYRAAWRAPSGGYVNPFALCAGLAQAVRAAGGCIAQHTPVRGLRQGDGLHQLRVDAGTVGARKVLVTTNGYTGEQWGSLARATLAVRLFVALSEPLGSNVRRRILPARECFSDLRRHAYFSRLDGEGRLLSAGTVFPLGDREGGGKRYAARALARVFPELGPLRIERYWEGRCAFPTQWLPTLTVLGPGVWAFGGYSGRGVCLAQALAPRLAELAAGEIGVEDVPVASGPARDMPWHRLKAAAVPFVARFYQAVDRLGAS